MNKTNLLIDLGIFAAFLLAMEPRLTGEGTHEWLSLGLAAVVIAHLLLHWKWIVGVLKKFFQNTFHSSRLKFVVDTLLFVSFVTVMMTGIMISKTAVRALGINFTPDQSFRMLHSLSANASLIMVGLHFALNWKWVATMIKRYMISPVMGLFRGLHAPVKAPVGEIVQK